MPTAPLTMPLPLRALLAGAFDYAGLFPPARLDLPTAVANYLSYRESTDVWALGRFVVPVGRLAELEAVLRPMSPLTPHLLPLTAVLGPDSAGDVCSVEEFNRRAGEHGAQVETLEAKAASAGAVPAVLAAIPAGWKCYLEIPLEEDADAALLAIASKQAFAKIRTGGITTEAFPSPDGLLRFLAAAARLRVPFKATAGLHHPVRGSYRLSYESAAPTGPMYGYFNLLLAAALCWTDGERESAREALLETDPRALRVEGSTLRWRTLRLATEQIDDFRRSFFHAIGSCSFREPVDELAAGGWW